jgi:hypothetical protein
MQAGLNEPTIDNTNYLGALAKAHKLIQSLQEKAYMAYYSASVVAEYQTPHSRTTS